MREDETYTTTPIATLQQYSSLLKTSYVYFEDKDTHILYQGTFTFRLGITLAETYLNCIH